MLENEYAGYTKTELINVIENLDAIVDKYTDKYPKLLTENKILKAKIKTFAIVECRWVSVNNRTPELIEGKDYSEIVHAWNEKHGYMYVRLCWINDGDNSGYAWDIHSSQYGIDTDPEETMYEEDFPTHWQELRNPNDF